jgi:subfamily B ATP-binding cassette protein MsbA
MNTFFRLLSYSKPYSRFLPEYLVFALLAVVFGVFNFSLLIPLLNVLFGTVKMPEVLKEPAFEASVNWLIDWFNFQTYSLIKKGGMQQALFFICGVIFVLIFLANSCKYTAQRIIGRMRVTLLMNLREAIFKKYTQLNLSYLNKERKGNLLTIIGNDVQEIEFTVLVSIEAVLKEPILIIGYFSFLFSISAKLTLFTLLYLPLAGLLINFVTRRLKSGNGLMLMSSLTSLTEETLSGLRIVRIFNAEEFVQSRFRQLNTEFRNFLKNWMNKREMASPASEILGVLSAIGIILYGGSLVVTGNGELEASSFITYIVVFSQILSPAKSISNSFATLQRGLSAGKRIFEIIDQETEIKEKADALPVKQLTSEISFRHVSFRHDKELILDQLNFELKKGEMLALAGPSGGGKSTTADLLVRFFDPAEGGVFLDGTDIRELKIADYRSLFGMVSQETILFNDTIFNNIAFGNPGASQEKVEEAARIANAHDFIMQTEKGYQTLIGDRGGRLSGGQRQRISIARAVLRNPQILILDEATSALDTESEKLVQDALSKLMQGRTSIVIAHRLSTIQHADKILVLDKGKVVEQGRHRELCEAGGLYRKLVDLQKVGGDFREE